MVGFSDDDPMDDSPLPAPHICEAGAPQRGRERREGKRRERDLELQGSRRGYNLELQGSRREEARGRSQSSGGSVEPARDDRRHDPDRRTRMAPPVDEWRYDSHLGIMVHRGGCRTCKSYAIHVYQHKFNQDREYMEAQNQRDWDLTIEARRIAERAYDSYEDEIAELKAKIHGLEDQLDRWREDRPTKRPQACKPSPVMRSQAHEPSPVPGPQARGSSYAGAASRPVVKSTGPTHSTRTRADAMEVDDRDIHYPPLPPPSPKSQVKTPFNPPSRSANWAPAPREPPPSNLDMPRSTAEFDSWAMGAQQEGNELDLRQAQKYVRLASLTNPVDRTPLMSHAIATWRLPRWLPPDRQSAKGIQHLQDPDRMPQPPVNDTAEAWSRFMHCQLFQFRNAPRLILDATQVSLPHVRGMLLMKQQIPAGLPQKQKQILQLHLVEVFCTPGLY
jgi:hypothetical protein